MYATPVSKREKRPAKEKTDLFCRKNLENILVNLAFSGKKR